MSHKIKTRLLFLVVFLLVSCEWLAPKDRTRFITRDGLEPDRWASIWLVKTVIAPDAEILIKPIGSSMQGGIPFAVPESSYKRTKDTTAFSSLLEGYRLTDPVLLRMQEILGDIERASWGLSGTEAGLLELGFRRLQDRYGKTKVPVSCYLAFFDALYQGLKASGGRLDLTILEEHESCDQEEIDGMTREKQTVSLVPIDELLQEISSGKRVVFVDAREPEEFIEEHIPGAINVTLREVEYLDLRVFDGAERVVSYCIKDFRGYEVARALAERGVKNSSTMLPYGLAGWKSRGLPLVLKEEDEKSR